MPGKQPPPGTRPYQVLRALGSIYGTRDAGRAWYTHLKTILEKEGWIESRLERAISRYYDSKGVLVGVMFAHVDDLLVAVNESSRMAKDSITRLQTKLHLERRDSNCWEYCGKSITVGKHWF